MLTIARLFGKSPFAPLQTHMDKVASCVGQLPTLLEAWLSKKETSIEPIAQHIIALEKEASATQESIRSHLPKSLFLPVDRTALFEILSFQEQIARQAKSIAYHLLIPGMHLPSSLQSGFSSLPQINLQAVWQVQQIILELDGLLESSFGGIEAEKVKKMIEQVVFIEKEASEALRGFEKTLYTLETPHLCSIIHWTFRLIEHISGLSFLSQQLANRVRLLLELK